MTFEEAENWEFNPFDLTKVGKMTGLKMNFFMISYVILLIYFPGVIIVHISHNHTTGGGVLF